MKHLRIYIIGMWLLCLSCFNLRAQIDTTMSADYLVNEILLGTGVLVGNVKFTGEKHAIGIYTDSTGPVGITKGIILTSGNALYVPGPNKTPRSGWASNAAGDRDLDKIARGKTYDATVLEFDFVTMSENLSFKFVFGSEEYLEYVGSKFNDVFAFFITDSTGKRSNIARLPDGRTPITVNTVNHELNKQYYIDNAYTNTSDPFVWDVRNRQVVANEHYLQEEKPPTYNIQFDGFTTVLEARALVIPNRIYHIKIALADVGDGILDSGVFLEAGSFTSYGEQVVKIDDRFAQEKLPTLTKKLPDESVNVELPKITTRNNRPLGRIEFDFDEYVLSRASVLTLKKVYDRWVKTPDATLHVKGHTDNLGSDQYNVSLSQKRSDAVARALIEMGIPNDKLVVSYFGEEKPIKANGSDFGRARNRRVELVLIN